MVIQPSVPMQVTWGLPMTASMSQNAIGKKELIQSSDTGSQYHEQESPTPYDHLHFHWNC